MKLPDGHTALWWGSGSASPAQRHGFDQPDRESSADALIHLAETLELPGAINDYHFAIQRTIGTLWSRRRDQPTLFEEIERLCWLDLEVIRSSPVDFRVDRPEREQEFYRFTALGTLRTMYEREGLLRQALEVERIAATFGQGNVEELEAKVALLDGELDG